MSDPSKVHIHLVVGSTGAGKTTHAIGLAKDEGALRLSIDDWMTALFGPDTPSPIRYEWMIERIDRCEAVIWGTALQAARCGVSSVLDLGFTRRKHRSKFADLAREAGLEIALHFIDLPAEERWARVQRRNAEKGETHRLDVDRGMFDFIESIWEPPGEGEMAALNGQRIV